MRLIDADALIALIPDANADIFENCRNCTCLDSEQIMELINKTPTANLALLKEQEVVRCKDCRYGQYCTDGETTYQCFKWNSNEFGALHEQDWFCADGEN